MCKTFFHDDAWEHKYKHKLATQLQHNDKNTTGQNKYNMVTKIQIGKTNTNWREKKCGQKTNLTRNFFWTKHFWAENNFGRENNSLLDPYLLHEFSW